MVVSPAALAKLGTGLSLNPVGAGAGPFVIDSFKPKEAITLKKNPTYWDAPVYLDALKFVVLTGGAATYDGFKAGTVQAAFLREAPVIAQAVSDKVANYSVENQLGTMVMINHGVSVTCAGGKPENACAGKADGQVVPTPAPGASLKVRQAVIAAIDPETINQRTQQGKGRPSTDAFQKSFPWSPGVAGPKPDPDLAKRLVSEAKATGWDGKVRLLANNQPSRIEWSLAVRTMLEAAGIQVTPKNDLDVAAFQAEVITKKDYDLAVWGFNISPDDYGYVALDQNLRSDSPSNRMGYKSAAMDAALKELRLASSDAAKTAAFKKIAETWNTDAVSAVYEAAVEAIIWSPKVHGLTFTQQTMTSFDKAWIER
jgi:peptide/nickel transport system substrate-binding protein